MANTTSFGIVITADGKLAVREIEKVDKALGGTGKAAKGAEKDISGLGGALSGLGKVAGFAAVTAGIAGIGAAARSVITESEQLQRNMLRTEALIRATGSAAGFTAQQLHEQARQQALATLQSTEGIQAAQQVLLTFKSVAGDTFTRTIDLAMDMSTVFGQDLTSSVTQLGKALEDPQKGLSALRRVGVSFTEEQQNLIKSLDETGQKAQAQRVILDALAGQMGGVSRKEAEGLAGAIDTLKQRFQELAIDIGLATDAADKAAGFVYSLADAYHFLSDAIEQGTFSPFRGELDRDFGQFTGRLDDIDLRIVQIRESIKGLSEEQDSWFSGPKRDAQITTEIANLRYEMAGLNREREQLIELAVQDRDVERAAAAARRETTAATKGLSDALGKVNPEFGANLGAMIEAASQDGITLGITSGLRSTEKQAQLWADALVKYGSAEIARKWVAPPGSSMHEKGMAADIKATAEGYKWLAENVERFGLALPLANERWHVELAGARDTTAATKALRDAQKEAAQAAKDEETAQRKATKELERKKDEVGRLVDEYLPAKAAAEDLAYAEKLLDEYGAKWGLSAAEQTQILAAMRAEMEAAGQAATDMGEKIPTVAELWSESLKEMSRNIQNTLGDAFHDLFTGTLKNAKDFVSKLGDVILSAISDIAAALLMRPINVVINGVLGGTVGAVSGSASASGAAGTGGSSFMNLGSLASMFTGNSIGTALAGGYQWLGNTFSSGYAPGAAGSFGSIASGVSVIPNWAFGAGGIMGGLAGSMLFDGQYAAIGSSIGATIGTAAGASMAAYFAAAGSVFGPIGTVLGGLLGGVAGGWLGSLFGGGNDTRAAYIDLQGGQFVGTGAEGLSDQEIAAILQAVDSYNLLISTVAEMLGPEAEAIMAGWNRQGGPQGLDPSQVEGWLNQGAGSVIEAMVAYAPGLFGEAVRELWAASEGDLQVFAQGVAQLAAFYEMLPMMVDSLTKAGLNLGEDAERTAVLLMNAAGGYDNLIAMHSKYLDFVLSDEEKLAQGTELLQGAFGELGLELPTTREELQALVGGLDLTTEEGRNAYIAIMGMFDALQQYITASEAAAAATAAAAASLEALVYSADQVARLEMGRAAAEANAVGGALGIDITSMDRDQFAAAVEALGGVDAVIELLGGDAEAFIAAASRYYDLRDQITASEAAAVESMMALIFTQDQLTAMELRRASAEADAISMQLWGIQVSEMTRAEFAEFVASMGGMQAVLSSLGDEADAFIAAASTVFSAQEAADAAAAAAKAAEPFAGAGRYGASLAGLTDAIGQFLPAANDAAVATGNLADSLLDWVARVRGEIVEELGGALSLDVAQTQFAQQLALAQAGDQGALASITDYADRYLSAARQQSVTKGAYDEVAGYVTARVEALTRTGSGTGDPTVDELERLRAEQTAANVQLISLTSRMTTFLEMLQRWEVIGLPETRAA